MLFLNRQVFDEVLHLSESSIEVEIIEVFFAVSDYGMSSDTVKPTLDGRSIFSVLKKPDVLWSIAE